MEPGQPYIALVTGLGSPDGCAADVWGEKKLVKSYPKGGQNRADARIAKVKMQIVNFKLKDKGREHRFEDCSVTVALR